MDIETHRAPTAAGLSRDASEYAVSAASSDLAVDRRRVPQDNGATRVRSQGFLLFGCLRFLDTGSIPAAAKIDPGSTVSSARAGRPGVPHRAADFRARFRSRPLRNRSRG